MIAIAVMWVFDSSGILRGLALREPFAGGKPASYWRDVVASEWPDSSIDTEVDLCHIYAVPVLKALLRDEQETVRASAVYFLGECEPLSDVEPLLLKTLREDPSAEVEYQAVNVLG